MKVIIKGVIIEVGLIYKIERNYYVANLTMIGGTVEAIMLCDYDLVTGDPKNYPTEEDMALEFDKLLSFIEEHSSKSKLPYPSFI